MQPSSKLSSLYGPYVGRSLLEVGLSAIMGRIDPFRLLIIRKTQESPTYSLDRRFQSVIAWSKDIVSPDGAAPDWAKDRDASKYSRAIFDGCWRDLAWKQSIESMKDFIDASNASGPWISELRRTEPDAMWPSVRGRASTLYSSLSKGVHNEFVISRDVLYDRETVCDLLGESLKILAIVGLASHFVEHATYNHSPKRALGLFVRMQDEGISV